MPPLFVDPNIARAKTIDTSVYLDPRYFELAKEKIFAPSWQYLGHSDLVREPGSAYPLTLLEDYLDEPLVLTRDKDGKIHCLSNVCTHRGNLLVYEPCKLKDIVCKYHGRRFSCEGKFMSMPMFQEVENFPTADDNLQALQTYQWGKLLFTSLNPGIPAATFFDEVRKRVDWFPMEKLEYRADLSKDYVVEANWALYCENYLEGFHIPFVHPGLNSVLNFGDYSTEIFKYSNLQLGIAKSGEDCFELPPSSPDHGKNIAGYYFWVFPNLMLNFYPWGLSLNYVQPLDVAKCKVSFHIYVTDAGKLNVGAGGSLDVVEMEDEDVVQRVQKGIRSRFYKHGRYSVSMEKGTHHFHRLLAEFLG